MDLWIVWTNSLILLCEPKLLCPRHASQLFHFHQSSLPNGKIDWEMKLSWRRMAHWWEGRWAWGWIARLLVMSAERHRQLARKEDQQAQLTVFSSHSLFQLTKKRSELTKRERGGGSELSELGGYGRQLPHGNQPMKETSPTPRANQMNLHVKWTKLKSLWMKVEIDWFVNAAAPIKIKDFSLPRGWLCALLPAVHSFNLLLSFPLYLFFIND